jgi:predicted SAM-dependent methyltransferase
VSEFARLKVLARPFVRRRYFASTTSPKLHLGCGTKMVPGWLNADKFKTTADVWVDAYKRLPFPDASFDVVYSEHTIEHVRIDKVAHVLHEVSRILRPGGLFRVTCPDLELFARRYVADDRAFFQPILEHFQGKAEKTGDPKYWLVRTKGSAFVSRVVQPFHHHRWMYDFETLESCLREVGFERVVKGSYRHGLREDVAALDSPEREFETLYVDAIKSAAAARSGPS